MFSTGTCAQLACIWEATARKPGNVHRYCDFADVTYLDFLTSAGAIAPILDRASTRRVGATVLDGICATRRVVATNTNLGILLLLAPLAAVPQGEEMRRGVDNVLSQLDVADARAVYQAIRLASPGCLGRVSEQDVADEPTQTLREVMALAAGRDLVARQYANGFREIFEIGLPALERGLRGTRTLESAIIFCHLSLLAELGDSLIARKRGPAEAETARVWARRLLDERWPHTSASREGLAEFDAWLRAEGHSRNPGTAADFVTACLFVALREDRITLPPAYPWTADFPS
jgi:triphosphoribosyl-dephospho-CoA synthase